MYSFGLGCINLVVAPWKLPPLQGYHIFSSTRDVYLAKNHNEKDIPRWYRWPKFGALAHILCCLLDWSRPNSTTNMVLMPYSLGWLWCKILDCIGMDLCSCLSRCISVCCSVTILLLHIPGWIKPLRLVDVNQRWTCSLQIPATSSETRQTHQVYSTEHIKPYSFFAVMEEAAVLKADRPTSDWPRDV